MVLKMQCMEKVVKESSGELTSMPHAEITKSESLGIRINNLCFNKSSMWLGSMPVLKNHWSETKWVIRLNFTLT